MRKIPNSKDLKILNVNNLSCGTGAKFLECIDGHRYVDHYFENAVIYRKLKERN